MAATPGGATASVEGSEQVANYIKQIIDEINNLTATVEGIGLLVLDNTSLNNIAQNFFSFIQVRHCKIFLILTILLTQCATR